MSKIEIKNARLKVFKLMRSCKKLQLVNLVHKMGNYFFLFWFVAFKDSPWRPWCSFHSPPLRLDLIMLPPAHYTRIIFWILKVSRLLLLFILNLQLRTPFRKCLLCALVVKAQKSNLKLNFIFSRRPWLWILAHLNIIFLCDTLMCT